MTQINDFVTTSVNTSEIGGNENDSHSSVTDSDDLVDLALESQENAPQSDLADLIEAAVAETAKQSQARATSKSKSKAPNPYCYKKHPRANEMVAGLEILPESWKLTPVGSHSDAKAPFLKGWQNNPIDRSEIASYIESGVEKISESGNSYKKFASGFGLLTGEMSGGVLSVDCDGQGAIDLLKSWSIAAGEPIPHTVAWSSGKEGRKQLFFQVPGETRKVVKGLTNAKFKGETDCEKWELDFRYNSCQSVLPPSYHPTTGKYDWINSPADTEVAPLPGFLAQKLIEKFLVERLENEISLPPKPRLLNSLKSSESGFVQLDSELKKWYLEKIQLCNPLEIFNHPSHEWSGDKGLGLWYDEFPERSCSFYQKSNGEWILKDFSLDGRNQNISAITYEHSVNIKSLNNFESPKGIDYVNAIKSLALRMGWGDIPSDYSPERYEKLAHEEYLEHTKLKTDFAIEIPRSGRYIDGDLVKSTIGEETNYSLMSDAAMGDGKTTMLIKLCENKRITYITPTTALGQGQSQNIEDTSEEAAKKLNVTMREDVADGEYANHLLLEEDRLSICPPSLHRIKNRKADILIADEASQLLEFLLNGDNSLFSTEQEKSRGACISALHQLLGNHDAFIMTDAYLNNVVVEYIRHFIPDIAIYHIPKKVVKKDREVYLCSENLLENLIKESQDRNEKISIVSDSSEKVKALSSKFEKQGEKVISLYREVTSTKENQKLLNNPTKYLLETPHDIYAYSPTFGAGQSVNEEMHYDAVYAFNSHLGTTHFAQMLKRIRKEVPLYFTVKNSGGVRRGCNSPFWEEQKKWLLDNINGNISAQMAEFQGKKLAEELGISQMNAMSIAWKLMSDNAQNDIVLNTTAKLRAIACYEAVNREDKLRDKLIDQGYTVKVLVTKDYDYEKIADYKARGYEIVYQNGSDSNEEKRKTKDCKDELREIKAKNVISTPLISEQKYKNLRLKTTISEEDDFKIDRYNLETAIPDFFNFIEENSIKKDDIEISETEEIKESEDSEDLDLETQDKLIRYYKKLFLDNKRGWLSGVSNLVKIQHLDKLRKIENRDMGKLLSTWEANKILTIQDGAYLKSAKYLFVLDELKLFELLDLESKVVHCNDSLIPVCEALCNSKSKLKKLKQYFGLNKFDKFKTVKWLNGLLEHFSLRMTFVSKTQDTRCYQLQKTVLKGINLKGFREYIEEIELKKLEKRVETSTTEIKNNDYRNSLEKEGYLNIGAVAVEDTPTMPSSLPTLSERMEAADAAALEDVDLIGEYASVILREKGDNSPILAALWQQVNEFKQQQLEASYPALAEKMKSLANDPLIW